MSQITLEKIKEILCPFKTNKDFVNIIFCPLKDEHQLTFTDTFGEKHLSAFMKGNHDGKRRLNVKKLKIWSEMICTESIFSKMRENLAILTEAGNVTAHHEIYSLIELDRHEIPVSFINIVDRYIRVDDHAAAVLLLVLWAVYGKEHIDLLHTLYQGAVKPINTQTVSLLSHIKPCRPVFRGRDEIIETINSYFSSGETFLFLQGMGGIGKSECAKQYAEKYREHYDTVVFAEYTDSIVKLVNDNNVFTLTEPFVSERMRSVDGTIESDEAFYQRKISQIRLSANNRTLIILDNLDQYDHELENFIVGPFRVLVTTRWRAQSVYPKSTEIIAEITDKQILKEIFSEYYGSDISNDEDAEMLIEMFEGHTMALELIAKQMRASCLTPAEMLGFINDNVGHQLIEAFLMPNYDNKQRNMAHHIQKLFNIAGLTETERYILMCLSILPLSGMEKRVFKNCCGLNSYSEINNLIDRSWIRDFEGKLSVHSLVNETVQISCKPDLLKCKSFIDGLMREFTPVRCYHAVRKEKNVLRKIAAHIYSIFPEPQCEELYDFYEWTELILSHCCLYEDAIGLAEKLHTLYQKKYGDKHFRTARMLCRIGCGKIHSFENEKAIELLEQGRAVIKSLENRNVMQELYISDIDFTLSNQYMELYNNIKKEDILEYTEMLCHETIEIRNRLYNDVKDKLRLSCVVPYRNLALIEIIRGNYNKSAEYLEKSGQQCEERGAEFSTYFKNYAKAIFEINQHNLHDAIKFMQQVLYVNEHYFGKSDSRSVKVLVELGEIYEKIGDFKSAYEQYKSAYEHMNEIPYQDEKILYKITDNMKRIEKRI